MINFKDGETPLSAETFNNMQRQIYSRIEELENQYLQEKQSLALSNGWSQYGNAFNSPFYRKIGKRVFLGGLVSSQKASSGVIAELPLFFRPPKTVILEAMSSVAGTQSSRRLSISADGSITFNNYGTQSGDYVSLENISFDIE